MESNYSWIDRNVYRYIDRLVVSEIKGMCTEIVTSFCSREWLYNGGFRRSIFVYCIDVISNSG